VLIKAKNLPENFHSYLVNPFNRRFTTLKSCFHLFNTNKTIASLFFRAMSYRIIKGIKTDNQYSAHGREVTSYPEGLLPMAGRKKGIPKVCSG
jgi:hypothetical protein